MALIDKFFAWAIMKHIKWSPLAFGGCELSNEGKGSDIVNAVVSLANAVPIYDDALKPMMQETGKALSVVGRAVNVALMPVRGFVWGAEAIEDWIATRVAKKLEGVPEEKIVTPDLAVAGPTIEALKYSGHKADLSEMFAGLFASAMRSDLKDKAHPTFVEFIKSLSSLDARVFVVICQGRALPAINVGRILTGNEGSVSIVKFFNPDFCKVEGATGHNGACDILKIQSSVENLQRLGLVDATSEMFLTSVEMGERYEKIKSDLIIKAFEERFKDGGGTELKKSIVQLTQTGKYFRDVVFSSPN